MRIVLASKSPRRKQILEDFGYKFDIINSNFDEKLVKNTSPIKYVKQLAYGKAMSVFNSLNESNTLVIGADTIVVYKGKIIGKPIDKQDAIKTLKLLSNNAHYVYTGFTIVTKNKIVNKSVKSKVYFNKLSDELIQDYVDSKLPLDKAGSYGIQDNYDIVKGYKGSYNNIVGLPIEVIDKQIKKLKNKN